ncbi:hypothetical protein DUNSADRAFT_17987 [Dunaliella salina]|uniref:Encoded protein n=1 Tax=Dunaliella salina TaxID=3046 RepID=A0ABQ7G0X4_DUNSA|nr:hypothetical protein DUNSADRAFT_17987 [Dunaliella salina]|eukprot:KAF5828247.1 hypothetical protein DUNSADRAFT_17987 [Dunaliella salina]
MDILISACTSLKGTRLTPTFLHQACAFRPTLKGGSYEGVIGFGLPIRATLYGGGFWGARNPLVRVDKQISMLICVFPWLV